MKKKTLIISAALAGALITVDYIYRLKNKIYVYPSVFFELEFTDI